MIGGDSPILRAIKYQGELFAHLGLANELSQRLRAQRALSVLLPRLQLRIDVTIAGAGLRGGGLLQVLGQRELGAFKV